MAKFPTLICLLLVAPFLSAGPIQVVQTRGPAASEQSQYSPDGSQFVELSSHQMTFWDVATAKPVKVLGGPQDYYERFDFSRDGKKLLASNNGTTELWDLTTGKVLFTVPGHPDGTESVALSPDGQWGASGGRDNQVYLWKLAQGQEPLRLKGHQKLVYSVAFSPDSQLLASGSVDGTVKLWNVADGSLKMTLKGHRDMVNMVAFLPSGKTVVSASGDATVRLWDVATGKLSMSLKQVSSVTKIALSPDGTRLICDTFEGNLVYWDLKTGKKLWTVSASSYPARGLAISPDGTRALSMDFTAQVQFWDLTTDPNTLNTSPVAMPFAYDRLYPVADNKKVALPEGTWAVNTSDEAAEVYHGAWARLGRTLRSIAAVGTQYWAVGDKPKAGGFDIWSYNNKDGWKEIDGGAMRIEVDLKGTPWIVTDNRQIFQREGNAWKLVPSPSVWQLGFGKAGTLWIIDKDYHVQQRVGGEWIDRQKTAFGLATDREGTPYIFGPGVKTQVWKEDSWQPVWADLPYLQGIAFGKSGLTVLLKGGMQSGWDSTQPVEKVSDSVFALGDSLNDLVVP